jgi:hypothetical protein
MFRSLSTACALALLSACSSSSSSTQPVPDASTTPCTDANVTGRYDVEFTASDPAAIGEGCAAVQGAYWTVTFGSGTQNPSVPAGGTNVVVSAGIVPSCDATFEWTKPESSTPPTCGALRDESGKLSLQFVPDEGRFVGTYEVAACPETIGARPTGLMCEGNYLVRGTLLH